MEDGGVGAGGDQEVVRGGVKEEGRVDKGGDEGMGGERDKEGLGRIMDRRESRMREGVRDVVRKMLEEWGKKMEGMWKMRGRSEGNWGKGMEGREGMVLVLEDAGGDTGEEEE